MFVMNDDLSIYVTRGDIASFPVQDVRTGKPRKFLVGEVVRIKVFEKKACKNVVLQKDFPVEEITEKVMINLTAADTKIGEVISKPKDYWYEVELNPYDHPETFIGYDEDGPVVFRLYPEGGDTDPYEPVPEDFPVVDTELDMTSPRPVANQAIARAFASLEDGYERTHAAVAELHVTPQMFGAIADGEADDTESLQALFDYGIEKQIAVYIPSGTYRVTDTLRVNRGAIIRGDTTQYDITASRIVLDSDADIPLISIGDGVNSGVETGCVQMSGLYLANSRYGTLPSENSTNVGLRLDYTTEMVFERMYIIGFRIAVESLNTTITTFRHLTTYYNKTAFDFTSGSTTFIENSNIYESELVFNNLGNNCVQNTHFESWVHFINKNNDTYLLTPSFRNCNIVSTKNTDFLVATSSIKGLLFDSCFIRCNSISHLFNCTALCYIELNRTVVFGILCYIYSNTQSVLSIRGFKVDSANYDGSGDKPTNLAGSAIVVYDYNHDGVMYTNGGISLSFPRKSGVAQIAMDGTTGRPAFVASNGSVYPFAYYQKGTTSERPEGGAVGLQYYDTDIGKPIFWNGTRWTDASGTLV
jgi:hypothetical protein